MLSVRLQYRGWELDPHNTMATYVLKEALNTMSFGVWKNVIEGRINLEVRSLKVSDLIRFWSTSLKFYINYNESPLYQQLGRINWATVVGIIQNVTLIFNCIYGK